MPRTSDEALARLKQTISLVRLVEADGIELKRKGADLHGHCPFHEDDSPSLVVTPSSNLYHCFGCGAAGSVVDWVMQREGLSFRHAVERLSDEPSSPLAADPVLSPDPDVDNPALLERVVNFYHETLKRSPDALAYLEHRGLANAELIDHFKLGYANRSLGHRLPPKQTKAGAQLRGQLQAIGVLRASGHEHFNGSLVIPTMSMDGRYAEVSGDNSSAIDNGQVTELYGRKIGERLRKGTPLHLYLPGPHRGVFNAESLTASKEIILCESLIDALTFWSAGFRNVTTAYGIEGFTDEIKQALVDKGVERVLIAFDRDKAGERGAEKVASWLIKNGIGAFRIEFPKGMDANSYACKVGPPNKSLGVAIRKARWLGNGEAPAIRTGSGLAAKGKRVDPPLAASEPETPTPSPTPPDLPASPLPAMQPPEIEADVSEHEVVMAFDDRRYRVRGLEQNAVEQMKINLLVTAGEAMHVDTLDLYSARSRTGFIRQAAIELGVSEAVIKQDLARVLLKLEQLQETPTVQEEPDTLDDGEREAALALLRDPDLLTRIVDDFNRCGLVGETVNTQVGYLAAVSRLLDQPLAVIIQSTSAAGKSALMEAVLNLMPEQQRVQYSAMTGQSLFYMGEQDLKNKILAISEEEGVRQAAYALKLLQSQGELTIASTGKDEATGNLTTREYRVEGPVMLLLTTTAVDIDEELMNRCVALTVNESREQTRKIHARQRASRTLQGLLAATESDQIMTTHQNAQRLLRPLKVVNPFAEQLTFLDDKTRTRRDHQKYLTLIDAIALLHQYQRPVHTVEHHGQRVEYIEATVDDICAANRLAHEVLGRSLDELPPQTRRLLGLIRRMVAEQCQTLKVNQADLRFSRRDIREYTSMSDGQLKIHCKRLEDLEYLLIHRGGRGQSLVYELLYDGNDEPGPHLMGLLDVQTLRHDAQKSGVKQTKSASSQAQVSPKSGAGQGSESAAMPHPALASEVHRQHAGNMPYSVNGADIAS